MLSPEVAQLVRTSSYINYVIGPPNEFTLVHSFTGAVDKVSSNVVQYLLDHRDLSNPGTHVSDEALAAELLADKHFEAPTANSLEMLVKRGYLTDKSADEEKTYLQKILNWFHVRNVQKSPPSFLLIPTYECNLRCPYCFETSTRVDLNRQGTLKDVISVYKIDEAFAAMDVLAEQRRPGGVSLSDFWKATKVGLYGGEPLQGMTKSAVEVIVERCRERGTTASAITNAVDLHLFEELLGPDHISHFQVTLDGPNDVHNLTRIGPKHRSTYDVILDNLRIALERGVAVSVRVHTDLKSIKRTPEILDDFEKRGLNGFKNLRTYITPRTQWHDGHALPIYPNMGQAQVYKAMLTTAKPLSVPYVSLIDKKLKAYIDGGLAGLSPMMEYCHANTGAMHLFDPYGDIYACWDIVGKPKDRVGTYSSDGVSYTDRRLDWSGRSPSDIPECSGCKYVTFHFGGCAGLPAASGKNLNTPACNGFPDTFVAFATRFFQSTIPPSSAAEMMSNQLTSIVSAGG